MIEVPTKFEMLLKEYESLTTVLSEPDPLPVDYGYLKITKALETGKDRVCKIRGIVQDITWHVSRSGNPYARLIVNDLENSAIILCWKNYHEQLKKIDKGDILNLRVKHLDGETFSLVKIENYRKLQESKDEERNSV